MAAFLVSTAGVPGTELSVNASTAPSDNPKLVAFDGTNYLVIWSDEVSGAGNLDLGCVRPAGEHCRCEGRRGHYHHQRSLILDQIIIR